MNLLDIPLLNNKKSAIAGYGLLIGGLGSFLVVIGDCMTGTITLQQCFIALQSSFDSLMTACVGLGIIGVAHKIEKKS